jgi:hypothetical protein
MIRFVAGLGAILPKNNNTMHISREFGLSKNETRPYISFEQGRSAMRRHGAESLDLQS